jgi:hypothetical protein
MGTELFKQLRVSVIIGYVLAWNFLLALGMWIGGGWNFDSTPARIFLIIALVGTSGLALAIAHYAPVQAAVLRSRDNVGAVRRDLWLLASITGVLASACVISFFAKS